MKKGFVTKLFTGLLVGALAFGMVPTVAFAEGNTDAVEEMTVEEREYGFGTSSNTATALTANVTLTEGYTAANSTAASNGRIYGSYIGYNSARWYMYTTTVDGYVTFTLKKNDNTDLNSYGWDLKIYEQGNSNVLEHYSNITGSQTTYRYNFPAGKTLLVKVDTASDGYYEIPVNSYYDLTANQTAVSGWETEDNNSSTTADEIVNGSIIGTMYNSDDVDYFKFNVAEKSKLKVTLGLELTAIENVGRGWDLRLYRDGESDYISYIDDWAKASVWTAKGLNYDYDIDAYPDLELTPGTYYLRVSGYYNNCYNEPYHFTIATEKVSANPITMYRLYNPNSGEHLYTMDANERDYLDSIGWNYEDVAWIAPSESSIPVYRVYNPNSGEHHYTTDANEVKELVRLGWSDEGIKFYSDENKSTAMHRLYNPNAKGQYEAGAHHYTKDENEVASLVAIGWSYEGIGWYGM